jgi:hypothetical protein
VKAKAVCLPQLGESLVLEGVASARRTMTSALARFFWIRSSDPDTACGFRGGVESSSEARERWIFTQFQNLILIPRSAWARRSMRSIRRFFTGLEDVPFASAIAEDGDLRGPVLSEGEWKLSDCRLSAGC